MGSTSMAALVPFKNKDKKGIIISSSSIIPEKKMANQYSYSDYPLPLASHEEVIADASVFWDTLRAFHKTIGTKHMVPVIGGKELNLHLLYAEVTRRGGFDKVVAEKKWREVSYVFEFGPTTTSASYSLRKHYFTLLHHYEQVHFLRLKAPPSPSSFEAVGTIDGKFDCGYLVSVKLGSEILSGVLYHPPHHHHHLPLPLPLAAAASSSSLTPRTCANVILPFAPAAHPDPESQQTRHTVGRRRRKRRGDPGRPKPNRSGYNFFFAEKHSMLKSLYPNREREFTKMIGESWNNLTPEERIVYQNYGLQDKERYQRELKEYKERMNLMNPI